MVLPVCSFGGGGAASECAEEQEEAPQPPKEKENEKKTKPSCRLVFVFVFVFVFDLGKLKPSFCGVWSACCFFGGVGPQTRGRAEFRSYRRL